VAIGVGVAENLGTDEDGTGVDGESAEGSFVEDAVVQNGDREVSGKRGGSEDADGLSFSEGDLVLELSDGGCLGSGAGFEDELAETVLNLRAKECMMRLLKRHHDN
jgi:hypothetical protein